MTNGQRVLVVDGLAETEQVLKAVLEPQGLEVNRIRTRFAQSSHSSNPPHVVILHEDHTQKIAPESLDSWPDIPRVVIGSLTMSNAPNSCGPQGDAGEQYLSQPFHYRDLINAVEKLLAE